MKQPIGIEDGVLIKGSNALNMENKTDAFGGKRSLLGRFQVAMIGWFYL